MLIGYGSLYGDGEELLGKWFKQTGNRDRIFLATKFGYVKGSKTFATESSAAYCKKACAESLRLLGIDSIDLCKPSLVFFILASAFGWELLADYNDPYRLLA